MNIKHQLKKRIFTSFLYRKVMDFYSQRSVARWTESDSKTCVFYKNYISPGDICFDVGANIGRRVKVFLKTGARVIAVEPQADCVKILKNTFGRDPQLVIIEQALGTAEGEAEMMISYANTISTLSQEWIDTVKQSNRFGDAEWNRKQIVKITTLDKLIEQYGKPVFIKIDVEGFEDQVISGLSQPVKAISFEFIAERVQIAIRCLEHLMKLENYSVNYSLSETFTFYLDTWVSPEKMIDILKAMDPASHLSGDIYIKQISE